MIYKIYNPNTGHGFDPVDTADPAAWIAERNLEGYSYELSTYADPIVPPAPPDPQALLDARIAAGNRLVRQFVLESESWGLGAADSLAMLQRFDSVRGLLQLGRLGTARTLLRTLPTDAVFTAEVRQRYISELDALLG